jgi:hypothetical protein
MQNAGQALNLPFCILHSAFIILHSHPSVALERKTLQTPRERLDIPRYAPRAADGLDFNTINSKLATSSS